MKLLLRYLAVPLLVLFMTGQVFGNPAMLPKHPVYPMGEAKSPVTGQPVANDPGRGAPTVEEARTQAAAFHESQVVNPQREERPNIVYEEKTERKK